MQVTVIIADKTVAVDGLALACAVPADPAVASIRWHGDALYGNATPAPGQAGGGDFRDPAVIAPYVAAWRTALQGKLDAAAAAATAETAAYQTWLAEQKASDAQRAAAAAAAATPAKKPAGK